MGENQRPAAIQSPGRLVRKLCHAGLAGRAGNARARDDESAGGVPAKPGSGTAGDLRSPLGGTPGRERVSCAAAPWIRSAMRTAPVRPLMLRMTGFR